MIEPHIAIALGLSLVASPFVLVTVWIIRDLGWAGAAWVWGMTLLMMACLGGGIALLASV